MRGYRLRAELLGPMEYPAAAAKRRGAQHRTATEKGLVTGEFVLDRVANELALVREAHFL